MQNPARILTSQKAHAFKIFDFNSEALDCNSSGYHTALLVYLIKYQEDLLCFVYDHKLFF